MKYNFQGLFCFLCGFASLFWELFRKDFLKKVFLDIYYSFGFFCTLDELILAFKALDACPNRTKENKYKHFEVPKKI